MDTFVFILKVFLPSLALSIAIKYLAPSFQIAPTSTHALIAVITPSIVIAIALLAQSRIK
ncbi:hypothetical protein [Myxacorys almedinensis]|uniref:Uncharacterized protein n=1 Tax=Myxacorys almedinensis A TaxID=2690445 RepID=A0A8J7Z5V3_9CYAN|nr:hypothetical protein [Myxacorys almedinensis]NDJ18446.1 hypothetical protein [Myxacorys almedinensis A]